MVLAAKSLTLDEFLQLPEEEPALELIDGEVTQKVSPRGKHSILQSELVNRINLDSAAPRDVHAFQELRTVFAGSSPVPDVSIYRLSRIPIDSLGEIANEFREPPGIAIEIVSPDQRVTALVRKCVWYVGHGVQVALLVDPDDRSIISFGRDRAPRTLRGSDPIDFGDIVPASTLSVQQLFDSLKPIWP